MFQIQAERYLLFAGSNDQAYSVNLTVTSIAYSHIEWLSGRIFGCQHDNCGQCAQKKIAKFL